MGEASFPETHQSKAALPLIRPIPLWTGLKLKLFIILLLWGLSYHTAHSAIHAELSGYYMTYSFSDSSRDSMAIAGLSTYMGIKQHSLAFDASESRDNRGAVLGHDYTGVYTYWASNALRYRVGWLKSYSEYAYSGQFTGLYGEQLEYSGAFLSQSQGLILGIFRDSYSAQGFKRFSAGLDLYICRHTTEQVTSWQTFGGMDYEDANWWERDSSERWKLQFSQYLSAYGKGIGNGYTRATLHFHYITLNEISAPSHESYQQLQLHLGHFGPRLHVQAMAAYGHAAYVYQSGGFVGYNTPDILKNGLGLEVGWAFTPSFSTTLKMQGYRYEDPQRQIADEHRDRTEFRTILAMLTYQF